jgi:nickel/cobalt exporter
MPSFNEYIVHGNAWLFFPMAVFLGALHGLEPGHSKTMMSAFIIGIRGTVSQAFLLGIASTISHTALIWVLAFVGLHYSSSLNMEALEPYFQFISGVIVIGLACWMLYQTQQAQKEAHSHEHGDGEHGGMMVNTGHGWVEISVFETNVPPRFRLYFYDSKKTKDNVPLNQTVAFETIRPDKSRQSFSFVQRQDYLEATEHLPEPHEFQAVLELKHGDHGHIYKVHFEEHHHHDDLEPEGEIEFGDAHERAHAAEVQKKLMNKKITTGQIILFGLTGGLSPCPSAFAILLLCLQLKKFALGFGLVLGFSIGLAITLVSVGVVAAVSIKHATIRFENFGEFARKAPYISSAVLIFIGLFVATQGLWHLMVK